MNPVFLLGALLGFGIGANLTGSVIPLEFLPWAVVGFVIAAGVCRLCENWLYRGSVWKFKKHSGFVVLAFLLTAMSPSVGHTQAQPGENPFPYNGPSTGDIAGAVVSALFGGSGELPVSDATTRIKTAAILVQAIEQLKDMLFNSQSGGGVNDAETAALIARIKQLAAQDYPLLWDGDLGAKWNDSHPGYHVFPEGGWIRNEEDRYKRSLVTQREVMKILQERSKDWEKTNAIITEAQTAISSAEGRNSILQANGAMLGNIAWQLQALTAMTMAGVNSTAAHNARIENERMSERMQERYVVSNAGEPQPLVAWVDRGLW